MFVEIVNVAEFLKQSRVPEDQITGMKETSMRMLSRCGNRKALPGALIHVYHHSRPKMHILNIFIFLFIINIITSVLAQEIYACV